MKHAISRASVGCERGLNSVSAARQHLGIAAGRGDRASFQPVALEHGEVELRSSWRAAAQPCWRRFYYMYVRQQTLLEKEILPGFGLTNLVFFCEFVERQGKSSQKGEGF